MVTKWSWKLWYQSQLERNRTINPLLDGVWSSNFEHTWSASKLSFLLQCFVQRICFCQSLLFGFAHSTKCGKMKKSKKSKKVVKRIEQFQWTAYKCLKILRGTMCSEGLITILNFCSWHRLSHDGIKKREKNTVRRLNSELIFQLIQWTVAMNSGHWTLEKPNRAFEFFLLSFSC